MQGMHVPYRRVDNDKLIYDTWYQTGTLKRAAAKLKEDGILNAYGRPFSPDGVRKAALRYVVNNYDLGKANLMKMYAENGFIVDELKIERMIIRMAVQVFHVPERIKGWMVEHDLMERHGTYLDAIMRV